MARTYKRDSRGRFASTGSSSAGRRPATKPVSRGTNRLTRDNAGRITSVGGNGATARGGRLRTAAGNLRARQIDRVNAAPKGVVSRSGAARAKVNVQQGRATAATSRLRPGELMNANARPVNTMARPPKVRSPYQAGVAKMDYAVSARNDDKKARLANAEKTKAMFEAKGLKVKYSSSRTSSTVASYNPATKEIKINRSHVNYVNPAAAAIKSRRRGGNIKLVSTTHLPPRDGARS